MHGSYAVAHAWHKKYALTAQAILSNGGSQFVDNYVNWVSREIRTALRGEEYANSCIVSLNKTILNFRKSKLGGYVCFSGFGGTATWQGTLKG